MRPDCTSPGGQMRSPTRPSGRDGANRSVAENRLDVALGAEVRTGAPRTNTCSLCSRHEQRASVAACGNRRPGDAVPRRRGRPDPRAAERRVPARAGPEDHLEGAERRPAAVPLHDQRLPRLQPRLHRTASPGRRTSTSGSTPARTSSGGSSSRSTPSSGCGPSCAARAGAGEHIAMGTNTDPYQRCEGKYQPDPRDRRGAGRGRQPVLDPDQVDAASCATSTCWPRPPSAPTSRRNFSIGTLDEEVWRITEPGTPPPRAAGRGGRAASTTRASRAAC